MKIQLMLHTALAILMTATQYTAMADLDPDPIVVTTNTVIAATITTTNLHTYTGLATGAGLTASNWDSLAVPVNSSWSEFGWREQTTPSNVVEYVTNFVSIADILVDARPEQNSTVTFTAPAGSSQNINFIEIRNQDHARFTKASGGTVYWTGKGVCNDGLLVFANYSNSNNQDINFSFREPYSITNTVNGRIEIRGTGNNNQMEAKLNISVNNKNDGVIYAYQNYGEQSRNSTQLVMYDSGVFINNGSIDIVYDGNRVSDSYNVHYTQLVMANGTIPSYVTLSGTGKVRLLELKKTLSNTRSLSQLHISSEVGILTNDVNHTIEGSGLMNKCHLTNLGLVIQTGTNGILDIRSVSMYHDTGANRSGMKAIINTPSGRIVATGQNTGVFLGNGDTSSTRPGKVLNYGLLEARTGSWIAYRQNATQTKNPDVILTTNTDLQTLPAILIQSGTWAGGGEFRTLRPLQLDAAAVIKPGDLYAEDAGGNSITNGTGVSTAGLLTFTNSLILSAATRTEIQLNNATERGITYDSVAVGGDFTLDGVLDVSQLGNNIGAGEYVIFTWPPDRSFVDNGLEIGAFPSEYGTPILDIDPILGEIRLIIPPKGTLMMLK